MNNIALKKKRGKKNRTLSHSKDEATSLQQLVIPLKIKYNSCIHMEHMAPLLPMHLKFSSAKREEILIATAKGKVKSFKDHLNLSIIWQLLAHKYGIE